MRIYNTMTKSKEEFVPLEEGKVKMYACGITVYDECHVGHAKQAIVYDMISQYLRYRGYDVTYVRNYTDVDDKIINRANELNINALSYSADRIEEVERVLNLLRVIPADINPKASENIDNIIRFIEGLIEKGYAYSTDRGDVYYSVKSFPTYGKLSKRNTDELLNGVRKDVEEGKRDPLDFALWKSAKEGEIYWTSPWGNGRPGWHIECSVMIKENLGETIDIHGGGKDLIFPHHENEIAQSEALTGKPFVKYWSHSGLIKINGQKMSKSLGNTMTIRELLEKYNPEVIRYTFLSKHYSTDSDLNDKEFALSEKHMFYFYNTLNDVNNYIKLNDNGNVFEGIENSIYGNIEKDFIEAMDDDFNTVVALSNLFETCKYMNILMKNKKMSPDMISFELKRIKEVVTRIYGVIGLLKEEPISFIENLKSKHIVKLGLDKSEIEKQIAERKVAKENKDWNKADEIRNALKESGIILFDTKENTTWGIDELYNID